MSICLTARQSVLGCKYVDPDNDELLFDTNSSADHMLSDAGSLLRRRELHMVERSAM